MTSKVTSFDQVRQQADELLDRYHKYRQMENRIQALDELIRLYEEQTESDLETARYLRRAFLQTMIGANGLSLQERHASFLAETLDPEDFADLDWRSPDEVINFYELLYSVQVPHDHYHQRVKHQVNHLLRRALQQFERQGQFEKMFLLLQRAPTSPDLDDVELRRLRNRAYIYDVRRVNRNRLVLYTYLLLYALLVTLVFPLLFIRAENGLLQDQIEESTQLNLPEEERRFYTYSDGLYWTLITAASIGYGDITPQTTLGRWIASALGVMGVITIGVITGLILEWISPRRLD